jgi:ferritin-like metal-binding protein YciE
MRQRCSETLAEKKATDEKLTLLADSEVDVAAEDAAPEKSKSRC